MTANTGAARSLDRITRITPNRYSRDPQGEWDCRSPELPLLALDLCALGAWLSSLAIANT
jgi:hypothetical protein